MPPQQYGAFPYSEFFFRKPVMALKFDWPNIMFEFNFVYFVEQHETFALLAHIAWSKGELRKVKFLGILCNASKNRNTAQRISRRLEQSLIRLNNVLRNRLQPALLKLPV